MRGWKGGVSRGEGLGSGLGGVPKAAMLAAVQSLRLVVTTSPGLRLDLVGVLPVRTFGWAGGVTTSPKPSAGLIGLLPVQSLRLG
jgi:hypothetical protein